MFQIKEFSDSNTHSSDSYVSLEYEINNFLENNSDNIKSIIDIKYNQTVLDKYNHVTAIIIYETND
ncbi:hypothetical protein ACOL28_03705 [Aliarcobacter butzleri]